MTTANPSKYDGRQVLDALAGLPGGPELLALAEEHPDLELVGGSVRDILLGREPRELDAIAPGEVEPLARELARRLNGEATVHERFGTAAVRLGDDNLIDLARMRSESYPTPGALPRVEPGTPEQDLRRRDFTVNALAVALAGERRGQLRAPPGALEDLASRRLRVLHDASFRDDPTRILRLARYAARLRFEIEPHTAELAAQALADGALREVSGPRVGAELRLALSEAEPLRALAELQRLGALGAWRSGLSFHEPLVRAALAILPSDGSPRMLLTAALLLSLPSQARKGFLCDLELPSGEAERSYATVTGAQRAYERIDAVRGTDELLEAVAGVPVEGLALAAARRAERDGPDSPALARIERWLSEQRHMRLQITGDDLLAAGIPQGVELGERLQRAYRLLLDGQIAPGRETELRAALEGAP